MSAIATGDGCERSFTEPAPGERADDHDEEEREPRAPDENRPGECAAASKGHRADGVDISRRGLPRCAQARDYNS